MRVSKAVTVAVILVLTLMLCAANAVFAHSPVNEYKFENDNISYTISASVSATTLNRMLGADANVSMEFAISSNDEIEIATNPLIATDENFEHVAAIENASYDNEILNVDLVFEELPEKIYVRTPFVTKLLDSNVVIDDVSDLGVSSYYDEQLQCDIVVVSFDENDLEVISNEVNLVYNGYTVPSLYINQYFDEFGSCLGGNIAFVDSGNGAMNNEFSLVVRQTLDVACTEILEINLGG